MHHYRFETYHPVYGKHINIFLPLDTIHSSLIFLDLTSKFSQQGNTGELQYYKDDKEYKEYKNDNIIYFCDKMVFFLVYLGCHYITASLRHTARWEKRIWIVIVIFSLTISFFSLSLLDNSLPYKKNIFLSKFIVYHFTLFWHCVPLL